MEVLESLSFGYVSGFIWFTYSIYLLNEFSVDGPWVGSSSPWAAAYWVVGRA